MGFCVECRDTSPGPICYRCGANTIDEAPVAPGDGWITVDAASALCYLGWCFTALIFMVVPPYSRSRTVRFHAYQSILLTAFALLLLFCAALYLPLRYRQMAWWGIQIVFLASWLTAMVSAWMGRKISLPLVGFLAERQLITSGL